MLKLNDYISHKKYEESLRIEKLYLEKLDNTWKVIDNEKKVIEVINSIKIDEDTYYLIEKKVSALYMALAIKNPEKKELYKSKSKELYNNSCFKTKEILSHINIKDETMLLDMFTEIVNKEERKTTSTFNSCIPYKKPIFVKKLLKNKQYKMLSFFLNNQYFVGYELVDLILEFKWLEDDSLRKEMMTTLLKNYKYYDFKSFQKEMKYVFEDAPIFEHLQDFKEFHYYVDIMTERLIVARKESFSKNRRNSDSYLVDYYRKRDFLRLATVLDDNSSFMQEIPQYIRTHFYEESLKDKEPNKYELFEANLETPLDENEHFSYYNNGLYNLYINGKKVDSSQSSDNGYIRYRFNIKDKGKKVTIKYGEGTVTDVLEEKENVKRDGGKYWIIDKDVINEN